MIAPKLFASWLAWTLLTEWRIEPIP